eukprot:403353655
MVEQDVLIKHDKNFEFYEYLPFYNQKQQPIFNNLQEYVLCESKEEDKSLEDFQQWVTITLTICYVLLSLYAFVNIYLVLYKRGRYRNWLLNFFYLFAVLTLVSRSLEQILNLYYESSDSYLDWYQHSSFYQYLSKLPCFTHILTGDCILASIIDLLLQHQTSHSKKDKVKMMPRIAKGLILVKMLGVFTAYLYFAARFTMFNNEHHQNKKEEQQEYDQLQQLISLWVGIIYLLTFILLIVHTILLFNSIFSKYRGSMRKEKRQMLPMLTCFSFSYLYRLIFNFYQYADYFVFFLMFMGECVPLFMIFLFQYLNNRQGGKNNQLNNNLKKESQDENTSRDPGPDQLEDTGYVIDNSQFIQKQQHFDLHRQQVNQLANDQSDISQSYIGGNGGNWQTYKMEGQGHGHLNRMNSETTQMDMFASNAAGMSHQQNTIKLHQMTTKQLARQITNTGTNTNKDSEMSIQQADKDTFSGALRNNQQNRFNNYNKQDIRNMKNKDNNNKRLVNYYNEQKSKKQEQQLKEPYNMRVVLGGFDHSISSQNISGFNDDSVSSNSKSIALIPSHTKKRHNQSF